MYLETSHHITDSAQGHHYTIMQLGVAQHRAEPSHHWLKGLLLGTTGTDGQQKQSTFHLW